MKQLCSLPVKYALIMCGVVIVCLATAELSGQTKSPLLAFFPIIAQIVIWYLGIREKKRQQKGKLTYKQGVFEGFKMGLAFGIISPFIFLAYYLVVNPSMIETARSLYQLVGQPDGVVIAVDLTIQCISSILFGILYGAIFSSFLKTKTK